MIYCVVPQALADELYDKLADYYRDDPHVEVIIDRRAQGGKPRRSRGLRGASPPAAQGQLPDDRAARLAREGRRPRGRRGAWKPRPGRGGRRGLERRRRDARRSARLYIGEATNNVAEYRALLLGLELARELGAEEVEVVNDSELVARQIGGEYKVKHAGLKPLFARPRQN